MSTATSVPFDKSAEEAVIASAMVDGAVMGRLVGLVAATDFLDPVCRFTFGAVMGLHQRGEAINEITVANQLMQKRLGADGRTQLDEVGPTFLSQIVADLPTPVGVESYAEIVRRNAVYRHLIGASGQIAEMASRGGPDTAEIVARSKALIASVSPPADGPPDQGLIPEPQMLTELIDNDLKVTWRVPGRIPEDGSVIVAGDSEAGKTWLLQDLAAAVLTGGTWLGLPVDGFGPVLIIDEESSLPGFSERWRRILGGRGVSAHDLPARAWIQAGINLSTEAGMAAVERWVREMQPALLILETMIRVHGGDENASRDIADLGRKLTFFRSLSPGMTTVCSHHLGHPQQFRPARMRGSTDIRAYADSVLLVKPNSAGLIEVIHDKSRWGPKQPPILARIVDLPDGNVRIEGWETTPKATAEQRGSELLQRLLSERGDLSRQEALAAFREEGIGGDDTLDRSAASLGNAIIKTKVGREVHYRPAEGSFL